MLGLAEYTAGAAELLAVAQQAETSTVTGPLSPEQSYSNYFSTFRGLLHDRMHEVAKNAVDHYSKLLKQPSDPELVDLLVSKQYTDPYYGLNLNQRLNLNAAALYRKMSQSQLYDNAQAITKNEVPTAIDKVLTNTVPFGAHYYTDRRLMLGTLVKIEQDAVKAVAAKNDIRLIRWTLSHKHARPDICDDLAKTVDKQVKEYLQEKGLNVRPEGVYFVEDLPQPPHPNCQCDYTLVSEQGTEHAGPVQRTIGALTSLLRRILGR